MNRIAGLPALTGFEKCSLGDVLASRRDVLLGLASVALGSSLAGQVHAQARAATVRRIDVHHHFFPLAAAAQRYFSSMPNPQPILQYTPTRSLDALGQAGVDKAFLSCPLPFGDDRIPDQQDATILARETNEYGAKLASDHGERFGLFAVLPLPNIDASLLEVEYAFDTLRADGVGLLTSYGNRWLGDRAFEPVLDELNRRKAVVYTHPVDAPCCHNLLPDSTPLTVEWLTDTSRAIWSLINDGNTPGMTKTFPSRATRYSDTRFVWSHAGGTLLGVMSRFLGGQMADLSGAPAKDSRLYHLRRFFYDTAGSANRIQMQALKSLVGSSQIVFGSDYPFAPVTTTVRGLDASGFSPEELRAIYFENVAGFLLRAV
jgi:predicted TIM-barrel fold metal-dependent hydrolase